MSVNQFLPIPIQLSQASESERLSGSASSPDITRRSFLKRTGGVTMATLVAWNLASQKADAQSNYFSDGSSKPDWTNHILICSVEPAPDDYKSTWYVDDHSHPKWSSVPHIDISDSVGAAAWKSKGSKYEFTRLLDSCDQGYSFFLLHWLTYEGVIHKGDYVGACKPGGQMASSITAHFAVVQGSWTYKTEVVDSPTAGSVPFTLKDEFIYHTILSGYTEADIGVVDVLDNHPNEKVRVVGTTGKATPWMPLIVNGVTTGWVQVCTKWGETQMGPGGCACGQLFTSVATYLPKFTLKSMTESYQSSVNMAASLQCEVTASEKYTGGVNSAWSSSRTVTQALEVNSPPKTVDFALRWDHSIYETSRGLQLVKGPPMPTPRDVKPDLPPIPNA